MSVIAKRYAKAFFELAKEKSALSGYREEFAAVIAAYETCGDLRDFLKSPRFDANRKKRALTEAFSAHISGDTLNLLLLLADKARMRFLAEIHTEFERLADAESRTVHMTLTSAFPMDGELTERIGEVFRRRCGADEVIISGRIDPALLSGFTVQVGDRLFDVSAKGKLEHMRELMSVGQG